MIYSESNTAFRWYDAIEKQNRFKEYCANLCDFALMSKCDDILPFQESSNSLGTITSWKLKYLDGTMLVPTVTTVGVKASQTWGSLTITGTSNVMIIDEDAFLDVAIGRADWDTDLDTTMANLVISINTNTNLGTTWAAGSPPFFDNSAGYTASYDSGTNTLTITAPITGTSYNGRNILFSVDGGTWGGDAGLSKTLSGGVDKVIEYIASDTIDISDCIDLLNVYTINGINYIQYNGGGLTGCMVVQMDCGKWYSEISDGGNTIYSEVFEVLPITDIAFVQSKLPLFTGWRFLDEENKQTRYKEYCSAICPYYLISPNNLLPPFQIKASSSAIGIMAWKLVSVDGDCEILLDTSLPDVVTVIGSKRIIYSGSAVDVLCGKYYSVLFDGCDTWYSELIEFVDMDVDETGFLQTDDGINLTTDDGIQLTID